MPKYLERQGTFKAKPIEWSVYEAQSGAIGITVVFEAQQVWSNEDWRPLMPPAIVKGTFYVVKTDGTNNDRVGQMLCVTLGWGGSFAEVRRNPPPESLFQVEVKSEDYKGKTYYKVDRIRAENATPGGGEVSDERLAELDKKYGATLKAIAKVAAAERVEPEPPQPEEPAAKSADYGDIPF